MTTPALGSNSEENNNEVSTSSNFDLVGNLPLEIAQKILLDLPPEDLRSATDSCPHWKALVSCEYFWKKLCQRDHHREVEESKRSQFYTNFLKRYDYHWEGVYWYNYTVRKNWETNNYRESIHELPAPRYFDWQFFDDVIFAKGISNNLYGYILNDKEFKPFVFPMRMDDRNLGVISKEGKYLFHFISKTSLTVWDLANGSTVLDVLWYHVTGVHFYRNLIVLETCDKKFEVYNLETGQIEYKSREMATNVSIMDGRILFTTMDYVIHILKWDHKSLVTFRCCGKTENNKLLEKDDILFSFCTEEGDFKVTLCVWNVKTKTKLHSNLIVYSSGEIKNAFFMNKYLYLNVVDEDDELGPYIQLWDYMKGTLEFDIYTGIMRPLTSCSKISNDNFMILHTISLSTLGVWSLRTKEFMYDLEFTNYFCEEEEGRDYILIDDTKLVYIEDIYPFKFLHLRYFEID